VLVTVLAPQRFNENGRAVGDSSRMPGGYKNYQTKNLGQRTGLFLPKT
jgi:hypothetical protein